MGTNTAGCVNGGSGSVSVCASVSVSLCVGHFLVKVQPKARQND